MYNHPWCCCANPASPWADQSWCYFNFTIQHHSIPKWGRGCCCEWHCCGHWFCSGKASHLVDRNCKQLKWQWMHICCVGSYENPCVDISIQGHVSVTGGRKAPASGDLSVGDLPGKKAATHFPMTAWYGWLMQNVRMTKSERKTLKGMEMWPENKQSWHSVMLGTQIYAFACFLASLCGL